MRDDANAVEIRGLVRRYGHTEAVHGLNLTVRPGRCYGLFGRNGAGKTTTIKCLLNHLRRNAGTVEVFGHDPAREEVAVKSHIGYVPEAVGFYPWMSVRETLEYSASFRTRWNHELEGQLLGQFGLEAGKRISALSRGMKAQVALICAICPEPDLLLLDEPTSGLDPIVRREFLQTVIGTYQDGAPERRTVLVSTHLIQEWEGLIDEFTIVEQGRDVLSLDADTARERYKKLRLRFAGEPPEMNLNGTTHIAREGQEVVLTTSAFSDELVQRVRGYSPEALQVESLSLEEVFVAVGKIGGK